VREKPEYDAVLHAVGLPAAYNHEFVREAVLAIAAWKRWNTTQAARWLKARAVAAQETGTLVDKWWFVNALYRNDPRPEQTTPAPPMADPNCRRCSGSGWQTIIRAHPSGKVETLATRCRCANRGAGVGFLEPAAPARGIRALQARIGELANEKAM
jgi:hypothetical protein